MRDHLLFFNHSVSFDNFSAMIHENIWKEPEFLGVEILWKFPQSIERLWRKRCFSTKFPYQEIRWNYGILCSERDQTSLNRSITRHGFTHLPGPSNKIFRANLIDFNTRFTFFVVSWYQHCNCYQWCYIYIYCNTCTLFFIPNA